MSATPRSKYPSVAQRLEESLHEASPRTTIRFCAGSGSPPVNNACPECGFWAGNLTRKNGLLWDHDTNAQVVSDLCRNCEERPATENWVGEGGIMAYAHGAYTRWCKRCCLEGALKHCRESAARIPELEAQLATLEGV
jgi:hypothetical protein